MIVKQKWVNPGGQLEQFKILHTRAPDATADTYFPFIQLSSSPDFIYIKTSAPCNTQNSSTLFFMLESKDFFMGALILTSSDYYMYIYVYIYISLKVYILYKMYIMCSLNIYLYIIYLIIYVYIYICFWTCVYMWICIHISFMYILYTHTYSIYVYVLLCVSVCSLKMDYLDIHQNNNRTVG